MAVSNSLAKSQQKTTLTAYLSNDAVKNQINSIIGGKNGPRFISSIISAVNANSTLQECTNASILSSALLGESLKLSPSPQLGQFYMVPFNNSKKKCKEAQFQLGYKGYIQLAIRSGQYKKLNVLAIKEGELINFNPLDEEIEVKLIADESEREKAKTIGYYAMFEYTNGFKKAMYWSKEKMLAHADKYSQAFSLKATGGSCPKVSYADYEAGKVPESEMWKYSSFWYKDFDGMAYKTMLRQLISKWGVMSIDMQTALDSDMAVINEDGTKEYVEIDEGMIVEGSAEEVQNVENKEVADVQVEAEPQPQTTAEAVQQSFFQ